MKKMNFRSILMLAVLTLPLMFSCSKDGDDGEEFNGNIVINEDGKASNGSIFSIAGNDFYLDYVKYTIQEGHLVVAGYDKTGFKGVANIVASITFKGSYYEVLAIGTNAFSSCENLSSVTIPNSITSIAPSAFLNCI